MSKDCGNMRGSVINDHDHSDHFKNPWIKGKKYKYLPMQ